MKGRIGQRAFYDRLPAALDEAIDDWGDAHRPAATRRPAPTAARTPRRSSSRWARWPTRRPRWSTTCARQGRPVGCVAVTALPPLPGEQLAAVRPQRPSVAVVERTDEPAAADNPLTREVEGGPLRPRRRGLAGAARPCRSSAGPRLARRRPRATSPPSSTGWPTTDAPRRSRLRRPRHPPPAGPRQRSPLDLRPRRRLQRCAATRSAASARSPPTSSLATARRRACSAATSRPTRATARRRRACRRPTT